MAQSQLAGKGLWAKNVDYANGVDMSAIDNGTITLDQLQTGLDVVGFIPGVGIFADIANAGISAARGNWADAGINLVAAVPLFGDSIKAAKLGIKAAKYADEAVDAISSASAAATKANKNIAQWSAKGGHLANAGGKRAKFLTNSQDEIRAIVSDAIKSDKALFLPNTGKYADNSFRLVTDLGKKVGTRGETRIRVVIGNDGVIINAFPVKTR